MNLYILRQTENNNYSTYDSCVVKANNEEEARNLHPHKEENERYGFKLDEDIWEGRTWASSPDNVTVELIGIADPSLGSEPQVIHSSYNCG